jgi:putative nucleotidyltransferase-like protein
MIHPDALREEWGWKSLRPISRFYKGYSREHEFLLHLLGRPGPEQSLALRTAAPQVDWQRLFEITSPDLSAYLGYKINENGFISQCPARLLLEAGDARRATAARWLRLRFELRNLVSEFARHKVDFVVLKGAVLAFIAYPDSSLRPVSDIDLLVRPESLAKALELIDEAGFRCPKRFEFAHPASLKDSVVPGEEISVPLEKPGTHALIEVHTQLESGEPWFPVPIGKVWERTEETDWNDVRIRILDPHEFLFHLVLHLARGHFFCLGLRPLLDVHLWVELQEQRLDWEWIARECVRRGYGDWMYLTLKMVRDTFATQVPAYFFNHVAAPLELDRLQGLAYEQIWADRRAHSQVPPRLAITLSQPSVGRAISSLFRRMGAGGSVDGPTIPALKTSKNGRWLHTFRRLLRDLRVKAPQYARAWRNGGLAWSRLQGAARLVRGQDEIKNILLDREE